MKNIEKEVCIVSHIEGEIDADHTLGNLVVQVQ